MPRDDVAAIHASLDLYLSLADLEAALTDLPPLPYRDTTSARLDRAVRAHRRVEAQRQRIADSEYRAADRRLVDEVR